MATPTANYGFIKDTPSQLYDVAVVNANLDAIDEAIHDNQLAIASLSGAVDGRLDALEDYFKADAVKVSGTCFTAATGWTISEQNLWYWGPICQIKVSIARTGATIPTNNNGNISNVSMATWASGHDMYKPLPAQEMGFSVADAGIMWGGIVTTSGLTLSALPPKTDDFTGLASGSSIRGSAIFFRNMP